eukprot:1184640-Heterocapsa_arctica.AAC.1
MRLFPDRRNFLALRLPAWPSEDRPVAGPPPASCPPWPPLPSCRAGGQSLPASPLLAWSYGPPGPWWRVRLPAPP